MHIALHIDLIRDGNSNEANRPMHPSSAARRMCFSSNSSKELFACMAEAEVVALSHI